MSSRKRGRAGAQPHRPTTGAGRPAGAAGGAAGGGKSSRAGRAPAGGPKSSRAAAGAAAGRAAAGGAKADRASGGTSAPTKVRRAMPAGAEAVRAERQARLAQRAESSSARAIPTDVTQGRGIVWSGWIGTAVFLVTTVVAAAVPSARIVAVLVDLGFLLAGSGLYMWGWAVAAGRSRDSQISLWNLILLEDAAPNRIRARLLGAVGVQVIVAAATCWITAALAFGWLVPVWGIAHCELWGARYGVFAAREPAPARSRKGLRGRSRR